MAEVSSETLDLLFRNARSQVSWLERDLPEGILEELHDLMKWGPTSGNGWPLRVVYVKSEAAKERLAALAMSSNRERVLKAPVTAILGHDLQFHSLMERLAPANPGLVKMFRENQELSDLTAFRNGSLQGAYFMLAARALGLDCAPMSGFDNDGCDREFFSETTIRSNFICSLGYGDPETVYERAPRPNFDEVVKIL